MIVDRFTPYELNNPNWSMHLNTTVVEEIDREHRAIYDALMALRNTTPPDLIPENMSAALAICNAHFRHEHDLMVEHNYPFIESHRAVHAYTEKKFLEVISHPTHEDLDYLIDELLHHIDWYDRPFVQFLFAEKYQSV